MPETHGPQTLIEAVRHFADADTCHAYMIALKWPDGRIACPKCGSDKVGVIESRRMLQCRDVSCRKQFSAKVGTIFEDSPLPLSHWFAAVWLIANAKNGISSCELARALGVRQATAWFMLHRIREAMKTRSFRKLDGEIESDETYVGGRAENMHARKRERKILGRGGVGKTIVHGLLERGGEVRAQVVPNVEAETILPAVYSNVESGAAVYTDAHASYQALISRYVHDFIDHTTGYVRGKVHTNGIENFWSLLKRAIRGSYVAVAPFHLGRYVDEEVFRFNARKGTDWTRFMAAMRGVIGRRLTYRRLCELDGAGFMGIA
jgi:transposase-like protein